MIKKLSITIADFILSYLPSHWRLTTRQKMYRLILAPFKTMNDEWKVFRDDAITRANVSNQTMSIEWYLNKLFDTELERINIETNQGGGVEMGNHDTEPAIFQVMGNHDTEPGIYTAMTALGEDANIGMFDFAIYIPAAISSSTNDIKAVVKKYAYGWKTFTVIEF